MSNFWLIYFTFGLLTSGFAYAIVYRLDFQDQVFNALYVIFYIFAWPIGIPSLCTTAYCNFGNIWCGFRLRAAHNVVIIPDCDMNSSLFEAMSQWFEENELAMFHSHSLNDASHYFAFDKDRDAVGFKIRFC